MTDLHRVIGDLQEAAGGSAGAPPVAEIQRRRRRRRALRGTGVVAASVAAVIALGVTGATLADEPDPVPPAVTETAEPTPSRTPAPEPSEPEETEEPATEEEAAQPEPTDEPDPVDEEQPPSLDELVIRPGSLGPLTLGASLPGDGEDSGIVRWAPEWCTGTDAPGRWVPVNDAGPGGAGEPFMSFSPRVSDGRVTSISVLVPEPSTTAGVRVGSTREELRQAHAVELLATQYGAELWVVTEGDGRMVFEVATNPPDFEQWSEAELGRVMAIGIVPPDTDIDFYYPASTGGFCG